MVFPSSIFGVVGLAAAYITSSANAVDPKPLPWDGRCSDIAEVKEKYLTHILTMRNAGPAKVEDYVSVEKDGRKPGFNNDTGVINIAVDDKAIFKDQKDFRRSELVQIVQMNTQGTTMFHGSFKKDEPYLNKYEWQNLFLENKGFEIRTNAKSDPPKIMLINNGTYEAKWETDLKYGTWYNFKFGISRGASGHNIKLDFYASEGEAEPAFVNTYDVITPYEDTQEYHGGLLTLSDDKSEPKMDPKPDILSLNGVSVDPAAPSQTPPRDCPTANSPLS